MRHKTSRNVNSNFDVLLMPNTLVKQSIVFSSAACCSPLLFIVYRVLKIGGSLTEDRRQRTVPGVSVIN